MFSLSLQSTPVGSLQTGQEIVVSPNRDRHPAAYKVFLVFYRFFSLFFFSFLFSKPKAWTCVAHLLFELTAWIHASVAKEPKTEF